MSVANLIAVAIQAGKLAGVPCLIGTPWRRVCDLYSGVPYVWGESDCSRMFWTVSGVGGYLPTPRVTTASFSEFPRLAGPVDGCAAVYGDSWDGSGEAHVARVVDMGDGTFALWHAHGGGRTSTATKPGGPAGFSALRSMDSRLLGYCVAVGDVGKRTVRALENVIRNEEQLAGWVAGVEAAGLVPYRRA